MRFLKWITDASMTCRKHSISFPLHTRWIELQLHQLVHVLKHHHVAVQLHYPIILDEREWGELTPAIIEASIVAVVFVHRREEVIDSLLWDFADVQGLMTLLWEVVGVESNERVFRSMFLQRVIERQEAGEVLCVRDESCPYCRLWRLSA